MTAILLIEDNPDDEVLTRRAFAKNQISTPIIVARDGAEALDMLHGDQPIRPAVVLLDLQLPKLSGLEVLARLRADERTRLLPVVVLTTSKEDSDLIASYGRGANSYVRKPIDFESFVKAIGHLGRYWLLLNEPPPGVLP